MKTTTKNKGLFLRLSEAQLTTVHDDALKAGYNSVSDYIRHKLQLDRPRENPTGRRILLHQRSKGQGSHRTLYCASQVWQLLDLIREANPELTVSNILQGSLSNSYSSYVSTILYPDE